MSKLSFFLPVIAVAVVSSAAITPAGGEGTAGSRARSLHAARAPIFSDRQIAAVRHDTGNITAEGSPR